VPSTCGASSSDSSSHTSWTDGVSYDSFLNSTRPGFSGYGSTTSLTINCSKKVSTSLSVYKNNTQIDTAKTVSSFNPTNAVFPGSYNASSVTRTAGIVIFPTALNDTNRTGFNDMYKTVYGL